MRVALAQYDIQWEAPIANLEKIKTFITDDVDLLVLPEMCLTGFTMEPEGVAESMDGDHIQMLQNLADQHDLGIMGSLVVQENGKLFNRLMLFAPNQSIQTYDKRHLFTFGGESRNYTAGSNDGIFHLKVNDQEWKICARICYDLRFPAWCRNMVDYDLIVFVASWPEKRHHAWQNLIQARAIENQAYAIGVNRTGKDGNNLNYLGGSRVVDYNGDVLYDVEDKEGVSIVTLEKQKMLTYREKLPFLQDRDAIRID